MRRTQQLFFLVSMVAASLPLRASMAANSVQPCPTSGTLADLISFNDQVVSGCSIGSLRYFGFSWTRTGGTVSLAPNLVNYTTIASSSFTGLLFTSSGFSVTGNDALIYTLQYTEDPPPVIIRESDQDMFTETPVAPGFARIPTTICLGAPFTQGCENSVSLLTFHNGLPNGTFQLHDAASYALQSTIGVSSLIDLEARGASSSIRGFSQTTFLAPEPASYFLAAVGLTLLGVLRRKSSRFFSNSVRRSD